MLTLKQAVVPKYYTVFLCFKTSGWKTILSFKTEVLQLMVGNRDTQRRCGFDQSDQINCCMK